VLQVESPKEGLPAKVDVDAGHASFGGPKSDRQWGRRPHRYRHGSGRLRPRPGDRRRRHPPASSTATTTPTRPPPPTSRPTWRTADARPSWSCTTGSPSGFGSSGRRNTPDEGVRWTVRSGRTGVGRAGRGWSGSGPHTSGSWSRATARGKPHGDLASQRRQHLPGTRRTREDPGVPRGRRGGPRRLRRPRERRCPPIPTGGHDAQLMTMIKCVALMAVPMFPDLGGV
jgi:hypothetical protein